MERIAFIHCFVISRTLLWEPFPESGHDSVVREATKATCIKAKLLFAVAK